MGASKRAPQLREQAPRPAAHGGNGLAYFVCHASFHTIKKDPVRCARMDWSASISAPTQKEHRTRRRLIAALLGVAANNTKIPAPQRSLECAGASATLKFPLPKEWQQKKRSRSGLHYVRVGRREHSVQSKG